MTTEPKFIPKEAAEIALEDGITARVRLVDCVGFMVEGAAGHEENGEERLVKTPWYDRDPLYPGCGDRDQEGDPGPLHHRDRSDG